MISTVCDDFMGSLEEIEAMDTLPDDTLLFGFHGNANLRLGAMDVPNCQIIVKKEIATDYNDVEGISWSNNCQ